MGKYKLSRRSLDNMEGLHTDLIRVVNVAIQITPYDFGINESTVRTMEDQQALVEAGRSRTLRSRHVKENNECGLSCAFDFNVYDERGKITWDIGYFREVAQAFVAAAVKEGVQIELGILWKSFIDGPHVQLPWELYP